MIMVLKNFISKFKSKNHCEFGLFESFSPKYNFIKQFGDSVSYKENNKCQTERNQSHILGFDFAQSDTILLNYLS